MWRTRGRRSCRSGGAQTSLAASCCCLLLLALVMSGSQHTRAQQQQQQGGGDAPGGQQQAQAQGQQQAEQAAQAQDNAAASGQEQQTQDEKDLESIESEKEKLDDQEKTEPKDSDMPIERIEAIEGGLEGEKDQTPSTMSLDALDNFATKLGQYSDSPLSVIVGNLPASKLINYRPHNQIDMLEEHPKPYRFTTEASDFIRNIQLETARSATLLNRYDNARQSPGLLPGAPYVRRSPSTPWTSVFAPLDDSLGVPIENPYVDVSAAFRHPGSSVPGTFSSSSSSSSSIGSSPSFSDLALQQRDLELSAQFPGLGGNDALPTFPNPPSLPPNAMLTSFSSLGGSDTSSDTSSTASSSAAQTAEPTS